MVHARYFYGNKTYFDYRSQLDTGSDISLISATVIRDFGLNHLLTGRQQTLIGIGNKPVKSLGQIFLDVKIDKCFFPRIAFDVLDRCPVPVLIGRSLIQERVTEAHFDWAGSVVRVFQKHGSDQIEGSFRIIRDKHVLAGTTIGDQLKIRNQLVLDTLGVDLFHCDPVFDNKEKLEVADLLLSYKAAFSIDGDPIGLFPIDARIPTLPGKQFKVPQHPIAQGHRHIVDSEVVKMLADGVIETCKDSRGWNSPVFIVEKSDGSPRFVVNFKQTLNLALINEESFVMPNMNETLNEIGLDNEYYGSFDFKSGYWQIGLDPRDRYKTSFCWNNKNYQFCRIPFGLKTSGNIFSRAVHTALHEATQLQGISVYVDDIFLHAKCFKQYISIIERILKGCVKFNVKVSGKKTKLFLKTAQFLGRRITPDGYMPVPEYSQAILEIPPPQNHNQLQRFIGRLVWVKDFLEPRIGESVAHNNFSSLLKPMTALLHEKKFSWPPKAQEAFKRSIERLMTAPLFRFADFNRPFVLITDASQFCCGAVLMQTDCDGVQYICAAVSKTFTPTQQRWSTIERECFGIVFGMEKFRYFLIGRQFIIKTDHRPLIYVDKTNIKNPKVERWYQLMAQYDFIIQYIPGEQNQLADLLSRPDNVEPASDTSVGKQEVQGEFFKYDKMLIYRPSWVSKDKVPVKINHEEVLPEARLILLLTSQKPFEDEHILDHMNEMANAQREDPILGRIIEGIRKNSGLGFLKECKDPGLLKLQNQFQLHPVSQLLMISNKHNPAKVFVPVKLRPILAIKFHNDHFHLGASKVIELIRRIYFWPGLSQDVTDFVQSCNICVARKGSATNQIPPLLHLPRPSGQWQIAYMDHISFSEPCNGYKHVLTYICGFSRFLITVPVRDQSAIRTARALVDRVFIPFQPPVVLSSDRGSAFKSELVNETCRAFGTELKLHVAWRPESTGVLERIHRVLKDCIFISCFERKITWLDALPLVTKALNVSIHKGIGVSPFEVIFGHKNLIGNVPLESRPNSDSPVSQTIITRLNFETICQTVAKYQKSADTDMEKYYSRSAATDLEIGQKVFLKRPHSVICKENNFRFVGPYTVVGTNDSVVCISDCDGNRDYVHRAHCCPISERSENFNNTPQIDLPIPTIRTAEKPSPDAEIGMSSIRDVLPVVDTAAPTINPEKTGVVRYPKRLRTQTSRLNISSTKDQTY